NSKKMFHGSLSSPVNTQEHTASSLRASRIKAGRSRISDWPDHCHPQGYTQAKHDVIEQACASQMSITWRIPSQPAHSLGWEHEKPRKDRGGRSVKDGAERSRRRVSHS